MVLSTHKGKINLKVLLKTDKPSFHTVKSEYPGILVLPANWLINASANNKQFCTVTDHLCSFQ